MSEPFVGEIRMFSGRYAPQGWAFCDGQLLNIIENEMLFSLIGTTYGGDGHTTFALPDLRGRLPIHQGTGQRLSPHHLGEMGGAEAVTLQADHLPAHRHAVRAQSKPGNKPAPGGSLWAASDLIQYSTEGANATMSSKGISTAGVAKPAPHENLMPYMPVSFIIALVGIYPSPT